MPQGKYNQWNAPPFQIRHSEMVDKTHGNGEDIIYGWWCWNWMGAKNKRGHGQFYYQGRQYQAHRVAWFIRYNRWPKQYINHLCNNRACQNPSHMEDVSHQENVDWMVKCDRQLKGEENGFAKLTENIVIKIRNCLDSHRKIAKRYGISKTHVARIKSREAWRHVK